MKIEHLVKDRENGCPTGKKCMECNLYQPVYQYKSDGDVIQKWDCQINQIALLLGESKNRMLGVQQAVESARNESMKRQDKLLGVMSDARTLPRE